MTMGFSRVRLDLSYITNKPNFFPRVIICQLAFLFIIVLLFVGKMVVATRFKTKKIEDPRIELAFIIVNRFPFIALIFLINFPDLRTAQLDKISANSHRKVAILTNSQPLF